MQWPCSVAIIQEDDLARKGLRAVLEGSGAEIAFACSSPQRRPQRASPDLVLTDVVFDSLFQSDLIRELQAGYPVIFLRGIFDGARAFFRPDIGSYHLLQSLRALIECDAVLAGPRFIEEMRAQIPHALALSPITDAPRLTPDELQIIPLLAEGLTVPAMSEKLGFSPRSVDRRIQTLYQKLGARSAFDPGTRAAKFGFL
jgi:DNA-binding NarL/FixJ family response regulator